MTNNYTETQTNILDYLDRYQQNDLLRFITCGSVDDGKSTLIGRLLHDSKTIFEDQLASVTQDSKKMGTTGEAIDLALLVDGLQSEREQGITIDVAYRYFTTDKRKFIIADTPGHEQYTRNMATGASTADLAIILIDARRGVLEQTRRHSFIVSLLGIRHTIVAVNKMDLVGYSRSVFERIKADYQAFASQLNILDMAFVPISALKGDNVVESGSAMPWYTGDTLISLLETVEITRDHNLENFRFPVQYVNRPNHNFRGFSGSILSGVIQPGDPIMTLPSGKTSRIKTISTFDGELDIAGPSQAVTLTLEDEIDISRGDMIVKEDDLPLQSDGFKAYVVWMAEELLQPHKQYHIKLATMFTSGYIQAVESRIDVNTLERQSTDHLKLNEIAVCDIQLTQKVTFDRYATNKGTGSFIIIDRISNVTVGAGMIIEPARENIQAEVSSLVDIKGFKAELHKLIDRYFPD